MSGFVRGHRWCTRCTDAGEVGIRSFKEDGMAGRFSIHLLSKAALATGLAIAICTASSAPAAQPSGLLSSTGIGGWLNPSKNRELHLVAYNRPYCPTPSPCDPNDYGSTEGYRAEGESAQPSDDSARATDS